MAAASRDSKESEISDEEIDKLVKEHKYSLLPTEKMVPAARELWRAFKELENAEVTEDMKERVRLWKTVLCFIMAEDDAYRFRMQYLFERINMRKMKLTKEDKFFFRGKYFKVDLKKKFLGIDWDGFQY